MIKNQPLLAIVVPTRNRNQYVKSAIKSLVRIPSREIEVVIEDNSDSNELQEWILENTPDARISYNYSKEVESQTGNYERSMRGVTAEYVAFIGDDDGVNPEIVDAASWAKAHGIDALTPVSVVNYSWPDLSMTGNASVKAGEIEIRPFTCQISYPDGKQEMMKCARDVGQSFHRMPKAYYGIVSRKCLERVRKSTGAYFPGVSPDMASAVSLAIEAQRICYVDYPLFVPGSSQRSLAGVSGMRKHVGELRDQTHLPQTCEDSWSTIIPKFFSVQTIWGEAAISAIYANKQNAVLRQCNIAKYYADCLIRHPRFCRSILRQLPCALRAVDQKVGWGITQFAAMCLAGVVRRQLSRTVGGVCRCFKTARRTESYRAAGIVDIEEAVMAFSKFLRDRNHSFKTMVNGMSSK